MTNEVTGTGYTAGGVTMSGVSVSVAAGVVKIDWTTDPAWASSTITARRAVLYKSRGGAASADELVAAIDFGVDFSSTAGPFTITLDANGLLNLTN